MRIRFAAATLLVIAVSPLQAQTVVGLDGYHNNEIRLPEHYQWEGTADGSFSKFGAAFREHDVRITALRSKIDRASLDPLRLLIIVDPETPEETTDPKYIRDDEIDAIDAYLVEVAPLRLRAPARSILTDNGTDIMALASVGQGMVFAVGDPWLYDEYIGRNDYVAIAANLFTMLLDD